MVSCVLGKVRFESFATEASSPAASNVRYAWWSQPVAATLYPDRERWSVWRCDKDTFGGSRWRPTSMFTSAIRKARGSVVPMNSTSGHARPWDLKPQQRDLTLVLHRPVELATKHCIGPRSASAINAVDGSSTST